MQVAPPAFPHTRRSLCAVRRSIAHSSAGVAVGPSRAGRSSPPALLTRGRWAAAARRDRCCLGGRRYAQKCGK
ncbi:hypothetical protein [Rubidibacter lacunae]|uniref:hypothetical protein n=1 Tax=Rubidibacter lacunae TaxID=582514 RepID=UPI0012ECA666|nr:hypothetical protein [Rubidibacter lacunae]